MKSIHENELTDDDVHAREFDDADGVRCRLVSYLGRGYWSYEPKPDPEDHAYKDRGFREL